MVAQVTIAGNSGVQRRPSDLRERKKRQTRQAIFEAADGLFATQGYSRTSIDEIAAAADVSRRTFFAYFPSKADLLLVRADAPKEWFLESFRAWQPNMPLGPFALALGLETVKEVIRSLEPVGAVDDGELERVHAKVVAISRTRWIDWEDRLTEIIRDAAGYPPDDLRARIAAGMILVAMRAAAEVVETAELYEMPTDYRAAALARAFELLEPSLSRLLGDGEAMGPTPPLGA
jgi:AcrR family transcriptional regulator